MCLILFSIILIYFNLNCCFPLSIRTAHKKPATPTQNMKLSLNGFTFCAVVSDNCVATQGWVRKKDRQKEQEEKIWRETTRRRIFFVACLMHPQSERWGVKCVFVNNKLLLL